MDKKYFFLRLEPNRPDFASTMTDEEKAIMQAHITYWMKYLNDGTLVVFGPVFDAAGTWGLGVVGVDNDDDVHNLIANDPASTINTYVVFPMRAVVKT